MKRDEWDSILFKECAEQYFSKDDVLYRPTDKCNKIGKIIKGSVRVSRFLKSGKEITIKLLKSGDYFAELIAFSNQNYPGWLIASEDTVVVEVMVNKVLSELLVIENLKFFLSNIAVKITTLTNAIELQAFKTVKQKVAYLILITEESVLRYDSITKLSIELACSREALSRGISELVNDGAVSRIPGALVLEDVNILESLFD